MKILHALILSVAVFATAAGPALAQAPSREEIDIRAAAVAARRAERDAARAERLPSRPVVIREPLPLPVRETQPPGGEPAGKSCPATESCKVEYRVPSGRILVVTALWSATDVRCDQATLGATPAGGKVIAPGWQCETFLSFVGKAAGFTGYLFSPPTAESPVTN